MPLLFFSFFAPMLPLPGLTAKPDPNAVGASLEFTLLQHEDWPVAVRAAGYRTGRIRRIIVDLQDQLIIGGFTFAHSRVAHVDRQLVQLFLAEAPAMLRALRLQTPGKTQDG